MKTLLCYAVVCGCEVSDLGIKDCVVALLVPFDEVEEH